MLTDSELVQLIEEIENIEIKRKNDDYIKWYDHYYMVLCVLYKIIERDKEMVIAKPKFDDFCEYVYSNSLSYFDKKEHRFLKPLVEY